MQTATPSIGLERTLTQLDHARLRKLAAHALQSRGAADPIAQALDEVLDCSEVVPPQEAAPDLVTMNSRVELEDPASRTRSTVTLRYPHDAKPAEGEVSVMSPVGASLLGARVGQTVQWRGPGGSQGAARVVALPYQPEAAGEYLR
ncbi:regulator of nucleoside diphosphate kinase [Variovorax sp. TBS-050B]|uniref:nucleoside diphosphate kinase regulator n=1 Tax=Variovorax sp. TBS-050B TaxID=2940551 RepID=UPI002473D4BE|nr:nucleoside diphosphate kinase regulator [Variovorax sp. TBS-050B]MDH6594236.1 regulator of nucleoside diphosphate kinase [Variovorax sp. TBS-050B]